MLPESVIDAQEKIMAITLLQMAFKKQDMTLEFMSNLLEKQGISLSVANISRYVRGKALPKSKLKDELLNFFVENEDLELNISHLIENHITVISRESQTTVINNTHLLNDSKTLQIILFSAIYQDIIPRDIDKVITSEVDGIPVAMTLAHLLNVDGVYARRKKPVGTTKFIYEDIESTSSSRIETIFFPDKFIRPKEKILIVDDIIRSGATQRALINLVRKADAIPTKCLGLIGIGKQWKEITELKSVAFKVLKVIG